MKNVLLSFTALVVTLLSISTVNAQSVKFHAKEPPTITIQPVANGDNINFQICVSGTVYGVGSASSVSASINANGTADVLCFNSGNGTGQEGGSVPGQNTFSVSTPSATFSATNGHVFVSICVTVGGSCKGNGMARYEVTDLSLSALSLLINGVSLSLNRFL